MMQSPPQPLDHRAMMQSGFSRTSLPSAILAWREPDRHDELELADA